MRPRYRPAISRRAEEVELAPFRRRGTLTRFRRVACVLGPETVGERAYDGRGVLLMEVPLRNGLKHGVEYHWEETGELLSAEPFRNGLPHGTARQWAPDGRLLGSWRMRRGTGWDVWRAMRGDGAVIVTELCHLRRGLLDGFEWWLDEDQRSVHIERHWREGALHGIEREWNGRGRLRRGWPRYYVAGWQVDRRGYLRARTTDPGLPPFRLGGQRPRRRFPPEVAALLAAR